MKKKKTGISDIQLYIPSLAMDLNTLKKERSRWKPKLERHLDRALRVTGQKKIRFPSLKEDTVTIATEAAYEILKEKDARQLSKLRFLAVGTESGVDHSKPVSAYVQGMLQKSGISVPENISSFQVQHACAGGTMALLSVAGMLNATGRDESGLVIASDISRYEPNTTAEVTQGAGAAALLIENDPKLLEIDLATQGYCSRDVDDFFRPLESKTAKVKGSYSMECYFQNLESAFSNHCEYSGQSPREVLNNTDMFVLHAPFSKMPESGMKQLLKTHLNLDAAQAEDFLSKKGFYSGTGAIAEIGNTYTASMYILLAHLLADEYSKHGNKIVGKTILLASYGSGNTMIVYRATIAETAPEVISAWDLERIKRDEKIAGWDDYQLWLNTPENGNNLKDNSHPAVGNIRNFALDSIRADGYREYIFIDQLAKHRDHPEDGLNYNPANNKLVVSG